MTMTRPALSIACLIAAAFFTQPALAKLYRWVDDAGNVHYADKIPPEYADQARKELSNKGITRKQVPRAKTPEEIAQEEELKRLRAEKKRLIAEQQASDRVLLRTFRSEDDIVLARDGKIAAIDVMIRVTEANIRRSQVRLADLQTRAANHERAGKSVPEPLVASIQSTLARVNENYAIIERREREKNAIRGSFEQDLQRFRVLKRMEPEKAQEEKTQHTFTLPNLILCPDQPTCDQLWLRAEEFVRRHATTHMQMLGEKIVMSAVPIKDDDVSITIARIDKRGATPSVLFMDLFCKNSPRAKEFCLSKQVSAIRDAFQTEVGDVTRAN